MSPDQAGKIHDERRDPMSRLPQLADAVIRLNIQDKIAKLKEAPAWSQPAGRSAETLVKYEDFRIVLVVVKQGSYMNDHQAEGPISIHVVQGRIRLHLHDSHAEELGVGDVLALKRSTKHDVEALEESAFLLTMSWPRGELAGRR